MTELKIEEGTEFLLRTDLPNRTTHIIVAVAGLYLGCIILGPSSMTRHRSQAWLLGTFLPSETHMS